MLNGFVLKNLYASFLLLFFRGVIGETIFNIDFFHIKHHYLNHRLSNRYPMERDYYLGIGVYLFNFCRIFYKIYTE